MISNALKIFEVLDGLKLLILPSRFLQITRKGFTKGNRGTIMSSRSSVRDAEPWAKAQRRKKATDNH